MLFGNIVGAIHESPEMKLNSNGIIVDKYIKQLNDKFGVDIDKYVIMPNHIHLLITVNERAIRESPLQRRSLISKVIGYLKMNASRDIHQGGYSADIFQRSYHDHVIRDERDYREIWDYIEDNPRKWAEDAYYKE